MTAAILAMEKPRHKMTPDEFNKRLAALGPTRKHGAMRWEQGVAKLSYESQLSNQDLGQYLKLSPQHAGRIVLFGFWLENEPRGFISDAVTEKLFRRCWQQTAKGKKQAKTDDLTRCLLVTPLIEQELAKPAPPPKPKVKLSGVEKLTLAQIVNSVPERFRKALKEGIDDVARTRAQEMTGSMRGFYEKGLAQAKAVKADYDLRSRTIDEIMTQAEFKLIRSCLHSDRQSEAERKKYDRAFDVFNRLEQSIKWD